MTLAKTDLNLLVYLDVLLREGNVTRAAQQLGISQPAMSNGLRRLRDAFDDPLLVRTSDGMTPTERAMQLQPQVRQVLAQVEQFVQPVTEFDAATSEQVFRIMCSDYAEVTLLPGLLGLLRRQAPNITLDIMTPSDVNFHDVEQGKVDLVINRFDDLPNSFHQTILWRDSFSCIVSRHVQRSETLRLDNYLAARHVWVSKTGMGVGVGVDPDDVQRLGWVDEALDRIGQKRNIAVFTRHYLVAMQHAAQQDLIATVPSRAAALFADRGDVQILRPPFDIPDIDLTMAWSPLLHNNPGHRWLRRLFRSVAEETQAPSESHTRTSRGISAPGAVD
ncbi:MAG: LysR family transcriptional regulator [Pseudomonadota bacterium]